MADDNSFKTGDSLWILTKKILGTLQAGGGGGGGGGGGAVTIADGTASGGAAVSGNKLKVDTGTIALVSNVAVVNDGHLSTVATITNPVSVTGNVGGITTLIKDTTAVSTSPAYTAGDAVGGKRTFANALTVKGTGILESITLLDRANQKAAMTLFIFDADPSAATITDNAAFVFSTDDLKVIAQISIAAGDYVTTNSKAIAQKTGLGITLKGGSTSLYGALVTTGTPTFSATTDVQLQVGILQD